MQIEYYSKFHQHAAILVKPLKKQIQHFKMEQHKLANSPQKILKLNKRIMIRFSKLTLKYGEIPLLMSIVTYREPKARKHQEI